MPGTSVRPLDRTTAAANIFCHRNDAANHPIHPGQLDILWIGICSPSPSDRSDTYEYSFPSLRLAWNSIHLIIWYGQLGHQRPLCLIMENPSTPSYQPLISIFGDSDATSQTDPGVNSSTTTPPMIPAPTPPSALSSSNNTYIMSNSPANARPLVDGYRPKVTRTLGQRPACLVNASVTYCGNNKIYAFGGFDQYTDEVYNHVLRLDLNTNQWSLVDNYGDIPGVRMGMYRHQKSRVICVGSTNRLPGHTATPIKATSSSSLEAKTNTARTYPTSSYSISRQPTGRSRRCLGQSRRAERGTLPSFTKISFL